MSDEFYIGYLKQAPLRTARSVRILVVCVVISILAAALTMAAFQEPVNTGIYEFGIAREFEGILTEAPLPRLLLDEPFETASGSVNDALLIVGFGKFGLPEFAEAGIGKRVRFNGSLIYWQNMAIVEMNDSESFEILAATSGDSPSTVQPLGTTTLVGELVDTKCFFGVMKPGIGKVHRACAVICLEGGVPPGLLLRHEDGRSTVVMLAGTEDAALSLDPQWAARRLSASGQLELRDGIPILRTETLTLEN
jgi:hypothetical protein